MGWEFGIVRSIQPGLIIYTHKILDSGLVSDGVGA